MTDTECVLIDYLTNRDCSAIDRLQDQALSLESRSIFSEIRKLKQTKGYVDYLQLRKKLDGNLGGLLDTICADGFYRDGMDIGFYIRKANSFTDKANMQSILTDCLKSLNDPEFDVSEIKDRLAMAVQVGTGAADIRNVHDSAAQIEAYCERLHNMKDNMFKTGIHEIDKVIRGIAGGEVLTIIARAGAYKTGFMQHCLNHYIHQTPDRASVMFSIEMPTASVAERYLSISEGWDCQDAEMYMRDSGAEIVKNSKAKYTRDFKRLFVVDCKMSLDLIPEYVALIQREYKIKVGLIGIDYLGLVDAPGNKEIEKNTYVAHNTKYMAKALNLPVILLSQTNRDGTDGSNELFMHQGRGSGAIEDSADTMLMQWQEEREGGKVLCSKIGKNRKGPAGDIFVLGINRANWRFSGTATRYVRKETKCRSYE